MIVIVNIFIQIAQLSPIKAGSDVPIPYQYFPHMTPEINDFTGAARQRIPISVPAGRGSIQPDLAFTYSSYQKGGWMGVGWRIEIDAIRRSTLKGVHYDSNDYVVLTQGQSVDLIYLGDNRFRARTDTEFTQYYLHRAENYWEVTHKDGTKHFFGMQDGTNARQANAIGTFLWGLDRVQDPNGNYMDIYYQQDQGEIYPDYIDYTGNHNTGAGSNNRVVFEYESEPGPHRVSYLSREKTVTARRLAFVKTFSYGNSSAAALEYRLEYDQSPTSGNSRLKKVRIIGNDGLTEMPSYAFTYKQGNVGTLVTAGPQTGLVVKDRDAQLADVTGDAKDDLITAALHDNVSTIYVAEGNGDGTFNAAATIESSITLAMPVGLWFIPDAGKIRRFFVDLNNDGRADLIQVYLPISVKNELDCDYFRMNIALCDQSGHFQANQTIIMPSDVGLLFNTPLGLIDFSNDGFIDILADGYLFENDGQGNFGQFTGKGLPAPSPYREVHGVYHPDINADGLADMAYLECRDEDPYGNDPKRYCGVATYHGDGAGNYSLAGKTDEFGYNMVYSSIYFNDVNLDGRVDLVFIETDKDRSLRDKIIYLSDGNGQFNYFTTQPFGEKDTTSTEPSSWKYTITGDLNGDGVTDYTIGIREASPKDPDNDATVTKNEIESTLSQNFEPFDLLETATSPSGVKTTFRYRRSSEVAEQHLLPYTFYTVEEVVVDDGVENRTSTDNYLHQWGYYDPEWNTFRGFEQSTRTHADNSVTRTYYYIGYEGNPNVPDNVPADSDFFTGRIRQVDRFADASESSLFSRTTYTWNKVENNDLSEPIQSLTSSYDNRAFVTLSRERTQYYDDQTVERRQEYVYDDTNGNLLTVTKSGTGAFDIIIEYDYTNHGPDQWNPLWRNTLEKVYYSGQSGSPARETRFVHAAANGNLLQKIEVNHDPDVADSIWEYVYYDDGNLRYAYDANGNRTTYAVYDASNTYPTLIRNPAGHETEKTWDTRWGLETKVTDPNDHDTTYIYDAFGRLEFTQFPDGGFTELVFNDYCSDDLCSNVGMPRDVRVRVRTVGSQTEDTLFYFDGLARVVQTVKTGEGSDFVVTKAHYDEMGRVDFEAGPFFQSSSEAFINSGAYGHNGYDSGPVTAYPYTHTTYDKRGRPTLKISPDDQNSRQETVIEYSGFATKTTDPDGCAKTEIRDHLERIIEVIDHPDTGDIHTRYVYNAANDLEEVRNHYWTGTAPEKNRIKMEYDSLGRKIYMDDPDMGQWDYQYDANSNMTLQTDAKGNRIRFDYDPINRIELKDYLDTTELSVTYQYDQALNGIGQLYSISNSDVTSVYQAYDEMGRPKEMTKSITGTGIRTTLWNYDYAGKVLRLTYPHTDASPVFRVDYAYHPGTSLVYTATGSDGTTYATLADYEPNTKIGNLLYGNSAVTDYTYGGWTQRLTDILTNSSGQEVQNRRYTYSPAGDITEIDDLAKVETYYYTYDKMHRLKSEHTSTGSLGVIPAIMDMAYDDPDHIHAVSSVTHRGVVHDYQYDPNGNMENGPDLTDPLAVVTRSLEFNADNMPVSVAHPNGGTIRLTYDGESKRARKSGAGKDAFYFSNEMELIDNVETFYIFAGNLRVAMVRGNQLDQPTYFHKDHLGSSTAMTNAAGDVIETAMYMPFGGKRGDGGISVSSYQYTDQELDAESGLYNYDARLYDPIVGRFASADVMVQAPFYSQSFNRYAYVFNNPLVYVDPTGYEASEDPDEGKDDAEVDVCVELNAETNLCYSEEYGLYTADKDGRMAISGFDAHSEGSASSQSPSPGNPDGLEGEGYGGTVDSTTLTHGTEDPFFGPDLIGGFGKIGLKLGKTGFKYGVLVFSKKVAKKKSHSIAANINFPDKKQLARMLGVNVRTMHKIKRQIKKDFRREYEPRIGAGNPNIGVTRSGHISFQHPKTGKTHTVDVLLETYRP